MDPVLAEVNRLAAKQHGVLRLDQVEPGQRRRLRYLAEIGVLERLAKGVYRIAGAPETWMQLVTASVWALGPSAVVSHTAAGRLLNLARFHRASIEITIERACRGRALPTIVTRAKIPVHTTTFRLPDDTIELHGLPVTSPERTIVDLACSGHPRGHLEKAIDSAIEQRHTDLDRLTERFTYISQRGRWRARGVEPLLLTSGGHSFLERLFLKVVAQAGLPLPSTQVNHYDRGKFVARVDFLYEAQGVVVEVSGGRGHSTPSERANDARRRNELQQLGRLVLEFTYEQVRSQPAQVLGTLKSALTR